MKKLLVLSVLLLSFLNTSQAATKNCHQSFWRNGIPREGNVRTAFLCEEFTPTINVLDSRYFNLYYHTSRALDPQVSAYFEKAAESLNLSAKKAKELFNYSGKIKIILDFRDHPRDSSGSGIQTYGNAYPFFANFGEACPIMMFPKSELHAPDVLGQIIAHEVFHCVQAAKWPDQTKLADKTQEGRWHIEGAAQWFSDVIYPSANFEYDRTWGHFNPEVNLVNQSDLYTTVIFFQSMWQSSKGSAFPFSGFFSRMPKISGDDQLAALSSFNLINVYYHHFVRNYISRTIKDAEGRNAPVGGLVLESEEVFANEFQELTFPLSAFKMQGKRLTLPAKSNYTLNYNANNDVRVSYKKKNESEWKELFMGIPNQLTTKCSTKEDVDIVFTSTKKEFEGEITISFARKELEDCGCEVTSVPVDSCLQGDWQMETSVTAPFMQSHYPPGTILKNTEGVWLLHLSEHSGHITYEKVKYSIDVATSSPTNPKVSMEITFEGKGVFEASSEAQNVCFKVRTSHLDFTSIIHFPSGDVRSNLLPSYLLAKEGSIELKCLSRNQILYRRHSGLTGADGRKLYVDWIFSRMNE